MRHPSTGTASIDRNRRRGDTSAAGAAPLLREGGRSVTRRRGVFAGLCAGIVLVLSAQAWACVFGPSVFLNTSTVKPGESVQVEGLNFRPDMPVVARMSSLDGPVLAEL